MVAYLAVRSGPEQGKQFPLDRSRPMHIGRGASCEIMLLDPVSSRFHAVVFFEDGNWHLRDTTSRNGTRVNGQKADQARLLHESVVTIGSTDLQLVEPEFESSDEAQTHQTLGDDFPNAQRWNPDSDDPIISVAKAGHLIDLYTLSLQLLSGDNVDFVMGTVLELICDRTDSSVVGISIRSDDGRHKSLRAFPADQSSSIVLGRSLARRIQEGEAIWINQETQASIVAAKIDTKWSDVMFVPLVHAGKSLGVLHLYRASPSFERKHFELAVAAGRLLSVGLARGIEHTSLKAEQRRVADRNADSDEFIGESPLMNKLKAKIERVGKANGSVLIRGESGAGKELVARAVHRGSHRSGRPMLTVNCAAIPRDLIESQLFGHKKGSFTGADNDHIGWFQQSHTGTLFLDEIGELTLEGQAKLLRILEGHPFLPVGATEEILVDVRVIAATNRDLAEFVREKKFREDLFYRLTVFELLVPPLRDRSDDIDRLIDHFLDHFRRQHGRSSLGMSAQVRGRLREYPWPGNVRQLRNVIDSAVVMADDPEITIDDLGLRDTGLSRLDTLRIDQWEQRLILKALERASGSVPDAAKLLGISRATAYRKITEYDIDR